MPLPSPVTAVAVERSAGALGRAAVALMQGVRPYFEDAHFLAQERGVCAVYDGHVGDEAAAFCVDRLHLHVEAAGTASAEKLRTAFIACDADMRDNLPEGCAAGACATFAVVQEDDGGPESLRIMAASCGDVRALLYHRNTKMCEVTRDHRPGDPAERARIEAAAGTVSEDFDPPRVDGQLACSRALGSFGYKTGAGLPVAKQKVSCVPEVHEWRAERGDWLLLASDGVWETLSNERLVEEICVGSNGSDLGDTLARILGLCIEKESDDNMTLMAIELGAVGDVKEASVEVRPGDFLKAKDSDVSEQYLAFCRRFGFKLEKEGSHQETSASLTKAEPLPARGRFAGLPAPHTNGAAREEVLSRVEATVEAAPEEPSEEALYPLVIVGPSGAGKSTLIKRAMGAFPERFGFSVSHTTRAPRPGEADGVDYHFVTIDSMQKEVEEDKFIEHANVHGNMYGTSKAAVEALKTKGQICVLDIDVQGARQLKEKKKLSDAKFLHIAPPSVEILERRLRGRGTESEEKVQKRITNAVGELAFCRENPGFFDRVLVNADLAVASREFLELIREWYPALTVRMTIPANRGLTSVLDDVQRLLEPPDSGKRPPIEVEVDASGDAIPKAARVVAELQREGHEVVLTATEMVEQKGARRSQLAPRLRTVLRLGRSLNGASS